MSPEEIQRQMLALQEEYAHALPAKMGLAEDAYEAWVATPDRQHLEAFRSQIHRLAGSGATFGYRDLSAAARAIELYIAPWLRSAGDPPPPPDVHLAEQFRKLVEAVDTTHEPRMYARGAEPDVPGNQSGSTLYVYTPNLDRVDHCLSSLRHFGFSVETFTDLNALDAALVSEPPSAVLADMAGGDGDLAGVAALQTVWVRREPDCPLVMMSTRSDFKARLTAVRGGADGYLVLPIDIDQFITQLDELVAQQDDEPYRVLIVDDDLQLLEHCALVLRAAGMQVHALTDPTEALDSMYDFDPELVVLDLYMPQCTGLELAQVIRQQQRFVGMPIVYLSAEHGLQKQYHALHVGADEFLTKPIEDDRLTMCVQTRVSRARKLDALIGQDSLTGLARHGRLKDRLAAELSRARRNTTSLVFVLIDIDRFKTVNDRYGHLAGDRVIRSLAHLLKHRVRCSDFVGRYGGEEFSIILPDCTSASALQIVDGIRQDFSGLSYHEDHQPFSVSFSAGVADLTDLADKETADDLIAHADAALYRAKRQGRNRVVLWQRGELEQ